MSNILLTTEQQDKVVQDRLTSMLLEMESHLASMNTHDSVIDGAIFSYHLEEERKETRRLIEAIVPVLEYIGG